MIPHRGGLPHSDTQGSTPARGFPWIFAACHVLHRLLVPRHPPNALLILTPTKTSPNTDRSASKQRPCLLKKPRHAQEPSTPKNTGHEPIPDPTTKPLTQHTLLLASWTLQRENTWSQAPLTQHPTPGQTTHANPSRTSPASPRPTARAIQQKPTEASCAPKTHQNLIHNQQRTRLDTLASMASKRVTDPKRRTPPNGSGPALGVRSRIFSVTTRPNTATQAMEADGIEPTTPCLQSRCSPN